MTAVTVCPRCFRHVSLPESDDHSVWVRCPLCSASYSLQTAIEFVPPQLEIVSAPALGAADEGAGRETAAAAAAFETETVFAHNRDDAGLAQAPAPGAENGEQASAGHHERSVGDFDAALSLNDEATDGDDVSFIAEQEHAMDEAEHDQEEDFRFADEHDGATGEIDGAEEPDHEGVDGGHALGEIATLATKPPKKKKKVPLTVRLIGYGIFVGSGVLGLIVVYAASLFFGLSDPLKIAKHMPEWLVSKKLLEAEIGRNNNPTQNTNSLRQGPADAGTDTTAQPGPNNADANGGQKNSQTGTETPPEKPSIADSGSPPPADPDAKSPAKPASGDVAAKPPGKSDPSTDPFANLPKPNDADAAKDDPTKLDPLAGTPKLPNPDMPDLKIPGKQPADKGSDKGIRATVPAVPDKTPDDSAPGKPADKSNEKPADRAIEKPVEKPTETFIPKSDKFYSLDDLAAAVDAATGSSLTVAGATKAADEKALTAARRTNFKDMSHLATVLTFVKAEDAGAEAKVQKLKDQIAASLSGATAAVSTTEREAIGDLAGKWIGYPNRKEAGIFAAGTLKAVEPRGKLFESQVELPGGKALAVVTSQKPAIAEGHAIVLLGAIVNDPTMNLPGYDGPADVIIFGDVLVPAPMK